MKQSNKGFDYSYNAQAVVDSQDQIIVAAETAGVWRMTRNKPCRWQAALNNLDAAGIERLKGGRRHPDTGPEHVADTGCFSGKAVEGLEKIGIDPHIAVRSPKACHETPVCPSWQLSAEARRLKEKMQRRSVRRPAKLCMHARTSSNRYSVKSNAQVGEAELFLLRGLEKVSAEWRLIWLDTQSSEDLPPAPAAWACVEGDSARRGLGRGRKGHSPAKPRGKARARDNTQTRS